MKAQDEIKLGRLVSYLQEVIQGQYRVPEINSLWKTMSEECQGLASEIMSITLLAIKAKGETR